METRNTLKTCFNVIGHGIFETAYIEIIHKSRNGSMGGGWGNKGRVEMNS